MDFRICDSYPKVIVVPKQLTDDDVKVVAHFRSGGRLPVLCWGDKVTMASIWRSSQPKAGVSGSCALDEKYLDIIAKSSLQHAVPAAFFDSAAKQPPDSISPSTVSKTVESSATLSGFQSFFRSSSNSSNSRPTSISCKC
jgi:hypothetical protein